MKPEDKPAFTILPKTAGGEHAKAAQELKRIEAKLAKRAANTARKERRKQRKRSRRVKMR